MELIEWVEPYDLKNPSDPIISRVSTQTIIDNYRQEDGCPEMTDDEIVEDFITSHYGRRIWSPEWERNEDGVMVFIPINQHLNKG